MQRLAQPGCAPRLSAEGGGFVGLTPFIAVAEADRTQLSRFAATAGAASTYNGSRPTRTRGRPRTDDRQHHLRRLPAPHPRRGRAGGRRPGPPVRAVHPARGALPPARSPAAPRPRLPRRLPLPPCPL